MKFQTIFIGNIAEMARPLMSLMESKLGEAELWEDHWLSDRFIFSGGDNRILITPTPIAPDFLKDGCRLLGFQNVVNWWPEKIGESVSEAIAEDKLLWQKLVTEIKANEGINLVSYCATQEFLRLTDILRDLGLKFKMPETPEKENTWLIDYFGSKAGFRQATASLGKGFPSMPQGGICVNKKEIIGWASYLLRNTAGFVIKANRGAAGVGLKIVKKEEVTPGKEEEFINNLLEGKRYWSEEPVVVEEFVPAAMTVCGGNPNIELMITPEGEVKPLYTCGMRVTPEGNFKGVEIGKGAVQKEAADLLFSSGKIWGEYLKRMGYRGFFEMDYIPRSIKEIYPVEANIRRTGGTHVHELAEKLLGSDYQENYYVVANNLYNAPLYQGKKYMQLKADLEDLLFPIRQKKEGVVLTIVNLLQRGQLGYLVIGPSRERTTEIEEIFQKRIS